MKSVRTTVLLMLSSGLLATTSMNLLAAETRTFRFDSGQNVSEWKIPLDQLGGSVSADWSGYEALVLELRASSSQRMILKIYISPDSSGEPRFSRVLFHPYPKVWIRAAVPVTMLAAPPGTGHDMAAVGNRSRPGYFLSLWGPFHPLKGVTAIGFEMEDPLGSPTLELRSVSLAKTSPGDSVFEGAPVVDQFGQFRHEDWPGKAATVAQLEKDWRDEEKSLTPGNFGYSSYGGYRSTKARATGFFRVEKIDGKWWFVDPEGHLFLSAGSDVILPENGTRKKDRESLFLELPPNQPGRSRDGDPGASFLTWNLIRRFGEEWKPKWIDLTIRRMTAWGLNTVANWSDRDLHQSGRMPYVIPLADWATGTHYLGLPDVYAKEFSEVADRLASQQCAPRRNDPWLLGYFLANEPPFPQKELQTVELILSGPDTATQRELQKWLASGDSEERRREFIGEAFNRYIEITSAAVKKHDPNHLNLGMRSGGRPTEAEIRASKAFDVYSVNVYNVEVPPDRVREISKLTGKPVLIGEFHFGSPARGLAASLVQVKDHKERGIAYRYYVEQAFSLPELIGTHWFQWADQPCTGRFDGENYNIGLVDVTDRPYPELIQALVTTHQRLYGVHAGTSKPFAQRPSAK